MNGGKNFLLPLHLCTFSLSLSLQKKSFDTARLKRSLARTRSERSIQSCQKKKEAYTTQSCTSISRTVFLFYSTRMVLLCAFGLRLTGTQTKRKRQTSRDGLCQSHPIPSHPIPSVVANGTAAATEWLYGQEPFP